MAKKRSKKLRPPNMESLSMAAECLKTLAHPVRIRIVQMLLNGRYTVGDLAEDCGIPSNVASEHLRLMQRCGFLRVNEKVEKSTTVLLNLIWKK